MVSRAVSLSQAKDKQFTRRNVWVNGVPNRAEQVQKTQRHIFTSTVRLERTVGPSQSPIPAFLTLSAVRETDGKL